MKSANPLACCTPSLTACRKRCGGLSLTELVIAVGAIGILAAIGLPALTNITPVANEVKARNNAQRAATVSSSLAGMGVAHVIPESMGGVEATVRLLREGVTVAHELMEGSVYSIPHLSDDEIAAAADHLTIIYDTEEIRLIYTGDGGGGESVALGP